MDRPKFKVTHNRVHQRVMREDGLRGLALGYVYEYENGVPMSLVLWDGDNLPMWSEMSKLKVEPVAEVLAAAYAVMLKRVVDLYDSQSAVIYQGADGRVWIRPAAEFHDGRFEVVNEEKK